MGMGKGRSALHVFFLSRERERLVFLLFTFRRRKKQQSSIKSQDKKMAPPAPASTSPKSENIPLFADKHVEFVAGFAKVISRERKRENASDVSLFFFEHQRRSTSTSSEKSKPFQDRTTFEAVATDHLRLSGVYWGLATLALLGKLDQGGPGLDRESVAAFVSSCAREGAEGVVAAAGGATTDNKDETDSSRTRPRSVGFGGAERHDAHLLYTLSAVQVAALIGRMDLIDADAVMNCEREIFLIFSTLKKNDFYFIFLFQSNTYLFFRPSTPKKKIIQTSPPSSSPTAPSPETNGER